MAKPIKWLYETALDMSQDARMRRAREMGYDTNKTWFHGTEGDVSEFKPQYLGRATGAPSAKQGYFFTSKPNVASDYSELGEGRTIARLNKEQQFRERIAQRSGKQSDWDKYYDAYQKYEDAALNWFDETGGIIEGSNVISAYLRPGKQKIVDFGGDAYRETSYNDLLNEAKTEGYESLLLKNTIDPANSALDDTVQDITVVFNPSQIRSVNAAFDPAKRESANLLASTVPAAIGLGVFATPEEAEAGFAGRLAKNADEFMLGIAQKMEAEGIPRDEIWQKTGWGKGVDDKWRFEIPDELTADTRGLSWGERADLDYEGQTTAPLGRMAESPTLSEAYPSLFSFEEGEPGVFGKIQVDRKGGSYLPGDQIQQITFGVDKIPADVGYRYQFNPDQIKTLSHEIQHFIQNKEGFAPGANPEMFSASVDYNALRNPLADFHDVAMQAGAPIDDMIMSPSDLANYESLDDYISDLFSKTKIDDTTVEGAALTLELEEAANNLNRAFEGNTLSPFQQYWRSPGEVEARNVEYRLNWPAEKRRAIPPWKSAQTAAVMGALAAGPASASQASPEYLEYVEQTSPEARYGTIGAPAYPRLASTVENLRDADRWIRGKIAGGPLSPAYELLKPSSVDEYLEGIAYGYKPSFGRSFWAGLDIAPF